MEPKLLNCPFCDAPATAPEKLAGPGVRGKQSKRGLWETGCGLFCVSMRAITRKGLVTMWNTRGGVRWKELGDK